MTMLSTEASNLSWLVDNFVESVPGVVDTAVVSSDGLLMAMSRGIGRAGGDQLAAVTSGLTSMTAGAARCFGGGDVNQIVVELEQGYMIFMAISDGSALAVLAERRCDVGVVGYEMTMLCKRVGPVLTPALIEELHNSLPDT
ncbi:MAG: roadblock/LC7 domain-containing protein [Actinomycetia bacterium]|nr:roadblock/LC7 domain-containing protein [Actinomycetes bacterium]MCP4084871.1 roadblock/LC7 domain-containing protein [Actinomycetes bacterium]